LHYRTGTVLAEHTVNHQKANNATTSDTKEKEQKGTSLDKKLHQETKVFVDEDDLPICSYCDKKYGSDFCKGCPEYDGKDGY